MSRAIAGLALFLLFLGVIPSAFSQSIILKAVERADLVKPREVPVQLWSKPGGSLAGAIIKARVPSGTPALILATESLPFRERLRRKLGLENYGREEVLWLKVRLSDGLEGWVRKENVVPAPK
ncbi:MAG: hypothetical protein ACE5LX_01075 [Nitrospinota bacterium]